MELDFISDFDGLEYKTHECNTPHEVYNRIFLKNSGVKILHCNIRSIGKNFDLLEFLINSFKENFHVIVCSESWEDVNKNFLKLFKMNGYNMYHCKNDTPNKCDGVVCYVRSDLCEYVDYVSCGVLNFMNINFKFGNIQYSVTCQYRSHDISAEVFVNNLNVYLTNKSKKDIEVFVGDVNIDILHSSLNKKVKNEYLNTLYSFGFRSYVNCITRRRNESDNGTCIDHCFVYNSKNLNVEAAVMDYSITDHIPAFCNIYQSGANNNLSNGKSTAVSKIDDNKLITKIGGINWEPLYSLEDVNAQVHYFVQKFETAIDDSTVIVCKNIL